MLAILEYLAEEIDRNQFLHYLYFLFLWNLNGTATTQTVDTFWNQ